MQLRHKPITHSREVRGGRSGARSWYASAGLALVSDRARFIAFAFFVALVALMGGGSRSDIQSLVVLRPSAVLFLAYALFCITSEQVREIKAPLLIVAALMLLALLQLVPLPASLWSGLPAREPIVEISAVLGMSDIARPLSLDPNRTWNTLFALFIPLAAVALAGIQAPSYRKLLLPVLVAVGLLSAAFGFLQAIGASGLRLYAITHEDYPVGLFANKNHQAVMLLFLMVVGSWLASGSDPRRYSPNALVGGALTLILVLFPLLILTGSRAGLALSVPALALCAWFLFHAPATQNILRRAGARSKFVVGTIAGVMIVPLVSVFAVLATSGRKTALSRLFEVEAAEEARWSVFPLLVRMVRDFLPFGAGFGSFENVFNIYEPSEALSTRYMNQAHNDLLQLVLEGGLPALAILLVALGWLILSCWRLWRSSPREGRMAALFFGGSIALWLAASLVDYPLRTPLVATLVAILTAQLAFLSTRHHSISRAPGHHSISRAPGDQSRARVGVH